MKRIGEILVENGMVTPDHLQKALEAQKEEPEKLLGEILIELGYVTEEDIVVAVATQVNVPYLPVGNVTLSSTLDELMPKELIQKYTCLPLERVGDLLTVVMADPTNQQAIRDIESATKCKVQAFVATTTEIAAAIQQYFRSNVSPVLGLKEGLSQISLRSAVNQRTEENNSRKT